MNSYSDFLNQVQTSLENKSSLPKQSAISLMAFNENCQKILTATSMDTIDPKLANLVESANRAFNKRMEAENQLLADVINNNISNANADISTVATFKQIEDISYKRVYDYKEAPNWTSFSITTLIIVIMIFGLGIYGYLSKGKPKTNSLLKEAKDTFSGIGSGLLTDIKHVINPNKKDGDE